MTFVDQETGEILEYRIHTSDRILFKQCRRKWDYQSALRRNLAEVSGDVIAPLWFGTGFHLAMEDVHGRRMWDSGADCLEAFVMSQRESERPAAWEDLLDMGKSMLDYYQSYWLPRRNEFQTVWLKGEPQVEVKFKVPIPGYEKTKEGIPVFYAGTFDRIVKDPIGRLWVVDYKTAARFDTGKLETDPQITSYTWAAQQHYGKEFEGVLYIQFFKGRADYPVVLKNGEFSQSKSQGATYITYTNALRGKFGEIPARYVDFVNYLAATDGPDGDTMIRRDLVRRNQFYLQSEALKILYETAEMLNDDLPIYPNPTRDCSYCAFRSPCLAKDDGSDEPEILRLNYGKRVNTRDGEGYRDQMDRYRIAKLDRSMQDDVDL